MTGSPVSIDGHAKFMMAPHHAPAGAKLASDHLILSEQCAYPATAAEMGRALLTRDLDKGTIAINQRTCDR